MNFLNRLSLSNKKWVPVGIDSESILLSERSQIYKLTENILLNRKISNEKKLSFLEPRLKDLLPDPFCIQDMKKGINRIVDALNINEKIVVFADYDVDGATSSAILRGYLRDCGFNTDSYIPDRIQEGYGPNIDSIRNLYMNGNKLIIFLDCGTTSIKSISYAKDLGLDSIIIDHHEVTNQIPDAYAFINPHRRDDNSNLKNLCTAGLTFLFVVALNRELRLNNLFKKNKEPDIRHYLDLVALGTICDVMPLIDLNRAFVKQGLKVASMKKSNGLSLLIDNGNKKRDQEELSTYHFGFIAGPRINAGGRIGNPNLGAQLLFTNNLAEAKSLAFQLNQYNSKRKIIENQIFKEAIELINRLNLENDPVLILGKEGWHPGVIGIVASRIKEYFHKPTCIISFNDKIGKGSGRSINNINLGKIIQAAKLKNLLIEGGGHAMAVGLSLYKEQFESFSIFMKEHFYLKKYSIEPKLFIDSFIKEINLCNLELIQEIKKLEPFGNGNPIPRFVISNVLCKIANQCGSDHIRVIFQDTKEKSIQSLFFRSVNTPLGAYLLKNPKSFLSIAGFLKEINKEVVFILEDLMEMS